MMKMNKSNLKELIVILIGDSWDAAAGQDGYNRKKILKDMHFFENEEYMFVSSCGFDLNYYKSDKQFSLLLHLGTSSEFYYEILKRIKIHFKEFKVNNGVFVKGFKFSKKTTSYRYYENDYLTL